MTASPAHVRVMTSCEICRAAIELECEGLPAYPGYATFNEYFCPACGRLNRHLTPGAIVSARRDLDGGRRPAA